MSALTGLRFFAAFYVFIFHLYIRSEGKISNKILHLIINNGALGVNIFFILSGLTLFYNYYDRKISWREFILKRIAKIYPIYLLGLLLSIGVGYITNFPVKNFSEILTLDLFLLQSYIPHLSMEWYGSGAWSISTEFFFYFLSLFIISMIKNLETKTLCILLGISYILSIVPGVLYNLDFISIHLNYTFPLFRLPEFLIGNILAALIFIKNIKVDRLSLTFAVGISSIIFYLVGYKVDGYTIFNFFIVPVVISILYLLINYPEHKMAKIVGGKYIEYLGKISYSFYIVQIPICLYLDNTQFLQGKNVFLWGIMIFVVNIFASVLAYHLLELPIHKWLNKKIKLIFNKN